MKCDTYHAGPNTAVTIAPDFGCNLFSWVVDNQQLLYFPEFFPENADQFFTGGNPILFPSVGRTWGKSADRPVLGRYSIYGCSGTFEMPIHGIGLMGKWQKKHENFSKGFVEVQYDLSIPQEVRAKHYPFDVILSVRYFILLSSIQMEFSIENRGDKPAPFAFGLHPYFKVERKEKVKLHLPCTKRVILDPELLIPVGEEPLIDSTLLLKNNKKYDMAYSSVNGKYASIINTEAHSEINIYVDEMIEMFVISTKPKTCYVCVEPWTKGLGGYEAISENNWENCGCLNVLSPNQVRTIKIVYSFEEKSKQVL